MTLILSGIESLHQTRGETDIDVIGRIRVGSNVFIGMRAILLPGITVGNDAVIGAGSVVTRDVGAGTVVAGVPARTIRTVDEYEARALATAIYVRNLPPDAKRRAFIEHTRSRDNGRSESAANE